MSDSHLHSFFKDLEEVYGKAAVLMETDEFINHFERESLKLQSLTQVSKPISFKPLMKERTSPLRNNRCLDDSLSDSEWNIRPNKKRQNKIKGRMNRKDLD